MCHLLPLIEFITSSFIIIIVTYIHTYTYTIIKFNYYWLYVHMLRADHLGLVNLPEELPWKKNWFFFTQKPLITYRSSSRGKYLSKFYLTFLSCSPLKNSHVVKNPWVEDPCLVQKILSWSSHVTPPVYSISLPTVQQCSLSLRHRGYATEVLFGTGTLRSLILPAVWSVIHLQSSLFLLKNAAFWWSARVILIFMYKNKYSVRRRIDIGKY